MYMSKPSRPAVDNDVTFPPTQTLSVTKHTRREQIDNDVSIPHHPKQKCNKKNCFVTSCLGASLGTNIANWNITIFNG